MWSSTFCFFPEAGSPLRMLASMASISLIITPNILSQKLNTSWGKREGWIRVWEQRAKCKEQRAKPKRFPNGFTGKRKHRPAGRQRRPGCWTAGWTRQPSCQNRRGMSRCSSSGGSRSQLSWRQCTVWTCQNYSCRLRRKLNKIISDDACLSHIDINTSAGHNDSYSTRSCCWLSFKRR